MNLVRKLLLARGLRRQFYDWDRERLNRHQAQRTVAVLEFAREHSAYYRRRLQAGMDFADVPLMDKKTMMAHFNEINTAGLDRDTLLQFRIDQERQGLTERYQGRYSVGLSSGTSGNKGLTVLSPQEQELYSVLLYTRSGLPPGLRTKRALFALRVNNPAFTRIRSLGITLVYVDYTKRPQELVKIINAERLNILAGPPSLLALLAAQAGAIQHPIDAVLTYAEVLDGLAKKQIETAFRAPVAEIYQGAEGFIASTCRAGVLHLHEDILRVERLPADGGSSVCGILLTDLYRTTQPVIRYRLGDLLELDDSPCSCGSAFTQIAKIHGREDNIFFLQGTDGSVRYLFPDYVRRAIIQASAAVEDYQALQHAADCIEIRCVLAPGAPRSAVEAAIAKNLAFWVAKTGAVVPKLVFSTALPELNPISGKMIRVVRCFTVEP